MVDKITGLLEMHFYTVFILGIVVLFFLTVGISFRRLKSSILPLFFTSAMIVGFIYSVYNRYKYNGKLEFILGIILAVGFIYCLVVYFIQLNKQERYYSIINALPAVENKILAYLNHKGNLIFYTNEFLKMVNANKTKDLNEKINYINIDEKRLSLESFLKFISGDKEVDYDLIVELADSRELSFKVSKRKIIQNGELLGYILIKQKPKVVVEEKKIPQINQLNLVSEAMALFDSDTAKFVLNNKMKTLLGVDELESIDEYVYYEDRVQIEKRAKNDGERARVFYRINSQNSLIWVEELSRVSNNKKSMVIRETDFSSQIYQFRNYPELLDNTKRYLQTDDNFILVLLSMSSLEKTRSEIGKDATLALVTQYFGLLNSLLKDLKVFEVGYYKYGFFIKNDDLYKEILRDLNDNNSILLKASVTFNDIEYEIKNHLSFVERKIVNKPTPKLMYNLAEQGLKLATDKNYNKDYSIYVSRRRDLEAEDLNVDLSDDFLDKILN